MPAAAARRLPGFRFETQPPPLVDVLPRMDVAVFVGFAASGPINIPVAVEDVAHFSAIFGDDAPLAWDKERGEAVYAYLAPAVRAFFRNGGTRCWIIRVAGNAAYNLFPVPGLVQVTAGGSLRPAYARARSEGSWSDQLEVSASLNGAAAAIISYSLKKMEFFVSVPPTSSIRPGDLVRLSFPDTGHLAFFEVKLVEAAGSVSSPPAAAQSAIAFGSRIVKITGGSRVFWFSAQPPAEARLGLIDGKATTFTASSDGPAISVSKLGFVQESGTYEATLSLSPAARPRIGSLLRITSKRDELWLTAQDVSVPAAGAAQNAVRIAGRGLWKLESAPAKLPSAAPQFEVLTFDMWVRKADSHPVRLDDLGFLPAHSKFWAGLPDDPELYRPPDPSFDNPYPDLWSVAASPRFPLAGKLDEASAFLPISMALVPEYFAAAEPTPFTPLERDGLAHFGAGLFIDGDMAASGLKDLMAQADFLRYQSPTPRDLTGIHAAMAIEEATIVAVPDAVHRGWTKNQQLEPADPSKSLGPGGTPDQSTFSPCDVRTIAVPDLFKSQEPAGSGSYTLSWSTVAGAKYILERASRPDFSGSEAIYQGNLTRLSFYGVPQGDYYYRVRAVVGDSTSNWSNVVVIQVAPSLTWISKGTESYSPGVLLAVQRALLRMCAARGDLLAVLSTPEHYREDEVLEHMAGLKSGSGPPLRVNSGGSPLAPGASVTAIGSGESAAFSYAALYHPWLIGEEENQRGVFRRNPPDGASTGIMARRSLGRGAWIAPANELLKGVVELTPPIRPDNWLKLQQAQINLFRQEPRGFLALNADTLSDDSDLRPINVRRLLILLRRLALRLGATYVFEPNDDSFRRMVQRGFEAMLKIMYSRGAFAGNTPDTSFQVVTGTDLNSPQSVGEGRFIVELRVAPSLPMTFLTVRLVQSGDRSLVVEVR